MHVNSAEICDSMFCLQLEAGRTPAQRVSSWKSMFGAQGYFRNVVPRLACKQDTAQDGQVYKDPQRPQNYGCHLEGGHEAKGVTPLRGMFMWVVFEGTPATLVGLQKPRREIGTPCLRETGPRLAPGLPHIGDALLDKLTGVSANTKRGLTNAVYRDAFCSKMQHVCNASATRDVGRTTPHHAAQYSLRRRMADA